MVAVAVAAAAAAAAAAAGGGVVVVAAFAVVAHFCCHCVLLTICQSGLQRRKQHFAVRRPPCRMWAYRNT